MAFVQTAEKIRYHGHALLSDQMHHARPSAAKSGRLGKQCCARPLCCTPKMLWLLQLAKGSFECLKLMRPARQRQTTRFRYAVEFASFRYSIGRWAGRCCRMLMKFPVCRVRDSRASLARCSVVLDPVRLSVDGMALSQWRCCPPKREPARPFREHRRRDCAGDLHLFWELCRTRMRGKEAAPWLKTVEGMANQAIKSEERLPEPRQSIRQFCFVSADNEGVEV
ncbi:hypothetical protein B0H63DRAFT_204631 [Podospora didyma]|uniref:Uncharacterized protein n=1 Tax=Podospora didyma TaxID=330526 RepID=A0AAE0NHB2_9PEZI|nr:hypothetical protein B0H63DRAFT_204631 [Podospora didyma]